MKRIVTAAIGVFIVLGVSPLSAKGPTARITVEGSGLDSPIDIRDPAVEQFHVWAGPGTSSSGLGGFIADWSSTVDPTHTAALERYQVSFYSKLWDGSTRTYRGERLTYVVWYVYDAASGHGYVYLPGRGDREYQANTFTIYRGPRWEGRWFRAAPAWQRLVTPLLATAQRPD